VKSSERHPEQSGRNKKQQIASADQFHFSAIDAVQHGEQRPAIPDDARKHNTWQRSVQNSKSAAKALEYAYTYIGHSRCIGMPGRCRGIFEVIWIFTWPTELDLAINDLIDSEQQISIESGNSERRQFIPLLQLGIIVHSLQH
jgi:hypothetical protein